MLLDMAGLWRLTVRRFVIMCVLFASLLGVVVLHLERRNDSEGRTQTRVSFSRATGLQNANDRASDARAGGIGHFTYKQTAEWISFTAHLNDASADSFGEQPYPHGKGSWTIRNRTLVVRLALRNQLHPDIVAFVCFMTWQDWLGPSVAFPKPVSSRLVEAVHILKPNLGVRNVNSALEPYANKAPPNELILSFGGGHDSSAVALLFKESVLVQNIQKQDPLKNWRDIPHALEEAAAFWRKRNKGFLFAPTNSRFMGSRYGLLHWMSILVPAFLLAADQGKYGVLTGSNMASSLLFDGERSVSRRLAGGKPFAWQVAFERAGIPVMHAGLGVSVILAAKLVIQHGAVHHSFYCNSGKDGKWCHRCEKCLRKELAVRAACELSGLDVFNATMIPRTPSWTERYPPSIRGNVFGKGVKQYRHATIAASRVLAGATVNARGIPQALLRNQIESRTARLHKTGFVLHHWANGLKFVHRDKDFIRFITRRFDELQVAKMTRDEEEQLDSWLVEPDV